jgi:hypothetical protein
MFISSVKKTCFLWERNGKSFISHHKKPWISNKLRGKHMAKCPKCATEVSKPKKSWKMAGRPDKAGKRMQLEIGLHECPKCKATFREVLSKKKI